MSTMLKTAAMTLLSKTLQTFLYKYLLDVDVEGVAMPSLMDVDGQSGWGVRLCNVRLREGVELMTLPGKRQVKKQKERASEEEGEGQRNHGEVETQQRQDLTLSTTDDNNNVQLSEDVVTELEELDRKRRVEKSDDADSYCSSRPPTPDMKETKTGVFGCFMRHPATEKKEAPDELVETPAAPRSRAVTQEELFHDGEQQQNYAASATTIESPQIKMEEKDPEESNDTDFVVVDQDMTLRLGNGGRIGTLDVRLVGKDLHVSVEDAFLVVEASPKPDAHDGNDTSVNAAAVKDAANAAAVTEEKSQQAAKQQSKKTEPPKTAGEKVLEKSVIARAISALPHLFLRDCRVQLILRDEPPASKDDADPGIGDEDSVVEIGVELLSVTSGEDILAHFRVEEEEEEDSAKKNPPPATYGEGVPDRNEFLVKRMRTGRGPEGGLWMKVYPRGTKKVDAPFSVVRNEEACSISRWSHQVWMSTTQYCFFRCSGLDVRARIFLGIHEEVSSNDWAFYDEFTIDTMLYSVDYIAPGSSPPLPPLERGVSTASIEATNLRNPALVYETDQNGVQSSQIGSTFHRVARGMVPSPCDGNHLPSENCPRCWQGEPETHSMDERMPLPGLVFNLMLKDPLELNVDRSGLEVLGNIVKLFRKENDAAEPKSELARPELPDDKQTSQSRATMALSSLRGRWGRKDGRENESIVDAFPSYMQPENIEITGVYISKVLLRIHVMREGGVSDSGFSFRYWDTVTHCVTLDRQTLSSDKMYSDIRFDVGQITMTEYRGTECVQLMAVGLPFPEPSDLDSVPVSSHSVKAKTRSSWPSTASELLNIQSPNEAAHFAGRERHGLQVRYLSLAPPSSCNGGQLSSHVDIRVGVLAVNMPYAVKSEISVIVSESKASLLGLTQKTESAESKQDQGEASSPSPSSRMNYKFQIDGGAINLFPVVNVRLPLTRFYGTRSSEGGLFLETLLQHVTMEYGARQPKIGTQAQLSLTQIASLPEKVRMRILLFLKDLSPLERALGVRRESNSFLRCRAVNRGLVKQAKRASKVALKHQKRKSNIELIESSRQEILTEILKLDDSTLQELWRTHQKSIRRHRRSRLSSDKPDSK